MWIWVMAPNEPDPDKRMSDYMFNYRPSFQYIPGQDVLEKWYSKMVEGAKKRGILSDFFDNTGLQEVDKKKGEKEKRKVDFAFTSHHRRSPVNPGMTGASSFELEVAAMGDGKRRRRNPNEVQGGGGAAGSGMDGGSEDSEMGQTIKDISVANIPFFKDDHLHKVAEEVLAEEEQKKKKSNRPGMQLKRTQSGAFAKKVQTKLADRSQGSYMVCHFAPPADPNHTQIPDDEIHAIAGTGEWAGTYLSICPTDLPAATGRASKDSDAINACVACMLRCRLERSQEAAGADDREGIPVQHVEARALLNHDDALLSPRPQAARARHQARTACPTAGRPSDVWAEPHARQRGLQRVRTDGNGERGDNNGRPSRGSKRNWHRLGYVKVSVCDGINLT